MTRSHWKVKIVGGGRSVRCVIHNRYSVSNVCLRILEKYLRYNLQQSSVMNCDALYATARSELALIEIFVNPGKIKSV